MVTSLDVSAVAGHHAMPAALLFLFIYVNIQHIKSVCNAHELAMVMNAFQNFFPVEFLVI